VGCNFTFAFFLFTFALLNWNTSKHTFDLSRPLVMGILNVTPDSFSDGGSFDSPDRALARVEEMIAEGADIIDVGGESTRPGSSRVSVESEIERVVPAIREIVGRFDVPVSIDTSKSVVARAALEAGAEIINDISGLRFDDKVAGVAAEFDAGIVLMSSRGEFDSMHSQPPVSDILFEVKRDLRRAIDVAVAAGVKDEAIILDPGIGFGKLPAQNLELIANLGKLTSEFETFPFLIGSSRKSFIGKILGDSPVAARLAGSLATAAIAVWNGAKVVRVHDVKDTVDTLRVVDALRSEMAR